MDTMEIIFRCAWEEMNAQFQGNLEERIHVDSKEMAVAQSVVRAINEAVLRELKLTRYGTNIYSDTFILHGSDTFILHGSVAEGTKVMAPNEFDYSIPIDLSAKDWEILPLKLTSIESECLIDDSQKEFFWSVMRRNAVRKTRKAQLLRNTRKIIDRSIVKQCNSSPTDFSAEQFYFSFFNCISNLITFRGDKFLVSDIESKYPAITLKVSYQSEFNSSLELSIDYVPTVKIGKRHFVAKRMPYLYEDLEDGLRYAFDHSRDLKLFYWRESFSYEELSLMKEIRREAEPLIQLFKQVKTVSLHIEDRAERLYIGYWQTCEFKDPSGSSLLPYKQVLEWSNLYLRTYHFKTVLLQIYRVPKLWRGADLSSMTSVYFQLLSEYCNGKCLPNRFNGKNLLVL